MTRIGLQSRIFNFFSGFLISCNELYACRKSIFDRLALQEWNFKKLDTDKLNWRLKNSSKANILHCLKKGWQCCCQLHAGTRSKRSLQKLRRTGRRLNCVEQTQIGLFNNQQVKLRLTMTSRGKKALCKIVLILELNFNFSIDFNLKNMFFKNHFWICCSHLITGFFCPFHKN